MSLFTLYRETAENILIRLAK